jgi:Xaa-Pro aminopeptidase
MRAAKRLFVSGSRSCKSCFATATQDANGMTIILLESRNAFPYHALMIQNVYSQRLAALRDAMARHGVDGYIVPRADEYQGEYVPASAERLKWLTAFTGSAGIAVVLKDRAVVLSDGRYTIQLKQQVDAALFETADSTKTSASEWLAANASGKTIGYDPRLHTSREIKTWKEKGVHAVPLSSNLIDEVWKDRPAAPAETVALFPLEYAGLSASEKLEQVGDVMRKEKCDAAVITMPDSIAWLLNVRSNDIPHNPVALSRAVAYADGTLDWLIEPSRVPEDVLRSFDNHVRILPPQEMEKLLSNLKGKKVLLDGRRGAVWFEAYLSGIGAEIIDKKDLCIALRAKKNKAEQQAMRNAHVRDGIAVTRFLKWLSKEGPREYLTEMDVEAKLESFRKEAMEFRDSSFDTIAGFGSNGAIIHYRATEATNKTLERWGLLLLDSGAQYADGTTDITRTIAIGQPSEKMKEHYTLVLKGHIAVAAARFPTGTTGAQVDALARAPLWQQNLDYAHGTGHGVGVYLSVHEEAASISPRGLDPVEPGMVLSNEPGYYKEGEYGIRLENLVLCHEAGSCEATGKTMLAFETLTLAPFDKALIVEDMLTAEEKFWLASYHKRVVAELSPYLDAETLEWLKAQE